MINYVRLIPEEKLPAIKPLLSMLSIPSVMILEKLTDEDLTDEERSAFQKGELEYKRGETVDFEDFLADREL